MNETGFATITIEGSAKAVVSAYLAIYKSDDELGIQGVKLEVGDENITLTIHVSQPPYSSEHVLVSNKVAQAFLEEVASIWEGYN